MARRNKKKSGKSVLPPLLHEGHGEMNKAFVLVIVSIALIFFGVLLMFVLDKPEGPLAGQAYYVDLVGCPDDTFCFEYVDPSEEGALTGVSSALTLAPSEDFTLKAVYQSSVAVSDVAVGEIIVSFDPSYLSYGGISSLFVDETSYSIQEEDNSGDSVSDTLVISFWDLDAALSLVSGKNDLFQIDFSVLSSLNVGDVSTVSFDSNNYIQSYDSSSNLFVDVASSGQQNVDISVVAAEGTVKELSCGDSLSDFSSYDEFTISSNGLDCSGNGLNLNVEDIKLDCAGATILGGNTGYGLYVSASDVEVSNCIIDGFAYGIFFDSSSSNNVFNSIEVSNSGQRGIDDNSGGSNSYSDIVVSDVSGSTALHVSSSSNTFSNLGINRAGNNGIYVIASNTFSQVSVVDSTSKGIYVGGGSSAFSDVFIMGSGGEDIYLSSDDNEFNSVIACGDSSENLFCTSELSGLSGSENYFVSVSTDCDVTGLSYSACEVNEVSCSDGVDNDGDGTIDTDDSDCQSVCSDSGEAIYYADVDFDGYGDASTGPACMSDFTGDYVEDDTDCNDNDASIYPGAVEVIYDTIDQDCDGLDLSYGDLTVESDCVAEGGTWDSTNSDCIAPTEGADATVGSDADLDGYYSEDTGGDDCNDNDASIYPGAVEVIYDTIDQDCDGLDLSYGDLTVESDCVAEGGTWDSTNSDCNEPSTGQACTSYTWYYDSDGDGYGDLDVTTEGCDQPQDYVSNSDDCDDSETDSSNVCSDYGGASVGLVDSSGNSVDLSSDSLTVGEEYIIFAEVSSSDGFAEHLLLLQVVSDTSGEVELLAFQSMPGIAVGSKESISNSFTPTSGGTYTVQLFVWGDWPANGGGSLIPSVTVS